jgi:spore coat polysaccharide biosynthesis protein SpsF (cytidylyltransferase family)
VQARFGSSRLPGKVLEKLAGRTVLSHVLERCRAIPTAFDLCCAVPFGKSDDEVAAEAERCGAKVVRGSEADVLDRYYKSAIECQADVIMRVTSDCPLLDPVIADRVLTCVVKQEADYGCNNLPRSWPHGLDCEAFTFDWLERAAREAKFPEQREHVTPFLRTHPDVRKVNVFGPGGYIARYRWTLDTAADLEFLRVVFPQLPEGSDGFDYRTVLNVVESEPRLRLHTNPE